MLWAGRIIVTLATLFFLFDAVMKIAAPPSVAQQMAAGGYSKEGMLALGVILIVATIAYAIPATAILGAALITGYLGGAVAANVSMHSPLGMVLVPVYFGIFLWAGVFLRDPRVRAVFPIRR